MLVWLFPWQLIRTEVPFQTGFSHKCRTTCSSEGAAQMDPSRPVEREVQPHSVAVVSHVNHLLPSSCIAALWIMFSLQNSIVLSLISVPITIITSGWYPQPSMRCCYSRGTALTYSAPSLSPQLTQFAVKWCDARQQLFITSVWRQFD